MKLAPIILFTYNRLWHTEQTINALKSNFLAKDSTLIIFSDASKNEEDKNKVTQVRNYIKSIEGFAKVEVVEQIENKGLANSIISGVSQVVAEFGNVIVLEDDMITSPYFITYMNEGLDLYENVAEVGCIHGYRYPIGKLSEPFFLKGADCWGWGTWASSWELFNSDGAYLLKRLIESKLIYDFNMEGSYPYSSMLEDQINGKNDSWAIRWRASMFLADKYCLYYNESLINNIGNDSSGTHSLSTDQYTAKLALDYEPLKKQAVVINGLAFQRIKHFYSSLKPTIFKRIKNKFFTQS
jgi:hypothetical protein